ncbi:MAG: hypothetical protein ACP5SB_01515 [Caldisericaceae bacterium]
MNRGVKIVLTFYFIFVLLVCVYVPWKGSLAIAQGTILIGAKGYAPIWSSTLNPTNYEGAEVDFVRIIVEIIGLTALFAIPFIFTYKPEDDYSYFEELAEDLPEGEEANEEASHESNSAEEAEKN